jgi:hypothetical protein
MTAASSHTVTTIVGTNKTTETVVSTMIDHIGLQNRFSPRSASVARRVRAQRYRKYVMRSG